ncbi:MAG: TrkH family potassium uptake protein [Candidatus Izemoplasmatales bacterium]|jgi:trk system potassium uptake protein TrkH|nr:TrkH family potassium uptake protein [Candidatus Izemoplasmatales bacterium]
MKIFKLNLNALQTLALGFAVIILIGSILLMLPVANKSGEAIPYLNALFTSASATCVTGLVVYDTYSQFTLFGQIVIMILIQIGGLGFMTMAVMFSMFIGRKIGLKERVNLMEAVNSMQIGGIVRMAKRVLIITGIFEIVGASLLSIRFIPEFGIGKGIWLSLFHSVSAFCNAGFDLMGIISPSMSLTPFVGDVLVNIVIIVLIVVGGIGFIVWNDVAEHRFRIREYRLHTKIVLSATFVIIITSALVFGFLEWQNAYAGLNAGEKIMASLFSAVTPRTAGFFTVEIASMTEAGSTLTLALMIIGAGPGSTAGGIKITTLVIILLSTIGYIRGSEDINIFGRRVEQSTVKRAFNMALLYIMIAFIGGFIILIVQNSSLHDVMFEAFSAIGTVGLSRGITESLVPLSRVVIILLMYSGRVGSMSIAMAFIEKKQNGSLRNPQEKVIIG